MNAPPVSPPFVRGAFRITLMSVIAAFLSGLFTVGFESAGIIVTIACAFAFLLAFTRYDFLASKFSSNATKTIFGISALFSALLYFTPDAPAPAAPAVSALRKGEDSASNNVVPLDRSTLAPDAPTAMKNVQAPPISPPVMPKTPTAVAEKSVSTTVDEVLRTYADNQMAGNRKYGGAKITISGRVVRVREALGTGILVLRSNRPDGPLELYFHESANDSLSALSPGQSVNAVCYSVLELMGSVTLSDCRSVN